MPCPDDIKRLVLAEGFDRVGITRCGPVRHPDKLTEFLHRGWAGQMTYLHRHLDIRLDSSRLFPGARSAIVAGINYWQPDANPSPTSPAVPAKVARYAWPQDYHLTLKRKLHRVADVLRASGAATQTCVDSAPIHERDLAAAAGIGWIGKHTLVLNRDLGSWLLLGVIVTDLDLPADTPATDHCGSCTACLTACPTTALDPSRPYQLDASQCISYATIELGRTDPDGPDPDTTTGEPPAIPPTVANNLSHWLIGCDICQEVCPFNKTRQQPASDADMQPRVRAFTVDAEAVQQWSEADRVTHFGGTGAKRVTLQQLKRNAHALISSPATATKPQ